MEQIERIKYMEQLFDQLSAALAATSISPEANEEINHAVGILADYYSSDDWKSDFAADEQGQLPYELKRGVLSEDGIWNLLSAWREIQENINDR